MKRYLALLVISLTFIITSMSQTKVAAKEKSAVPDFAFPEKVEKTAFRDLDEALNTGDGAATVSALVRLGLAKAQVSSDSIGQVLDRIDRIAGASSDPVVKSMLWLLEARIYCDVYRQDSYRINQRSTIAGASPADYSTWSRQQFVDRILQLVGRAVLPREELFATPIEKYSGVISYDRTMLTFYPTMYDFVAHQAIECLDCFDSSSWGILNPELVAEPLDNTLYPDFKGGVAGDVLRLYRSLIVDRLGGETGAPSVLARKDLIEYIVPRVFGSDVRQPLFPSGKYVDTGTSVFQALMDAYRECRQSPYAIELLLGVYSDSLNDAEQRELYEVVQSFKHDNPAYFNINAVTNLCNSLARKSVSVTVPSQGVAGKAIPVTLKVRNVGKVTLKLYDVTALMKGSTDSYCRLPSPRPKAVSVISVPVEGTVPFKAFCEAEVKLPSYGLYVVEPVFDGQERNSGSYKIISCSDLSAGVYSGVGDAKAVVVDVESGAPVAAAGMVFRPWSRASAPSELAGRTDSDGIMGIGQDAAGSLQPFKGGDRYSQVVNYYKLNEAVDSNNLRGEVFTALGLYRPGTSVAFSAVAYEHENGHNTLACGRTLTMGLRDANYVEIQTLKVVTDVWGRAEGAFTLPENGLMGDFTITMCDGDTQIATARFTVSDYKLPTFEVGIDAVKRPVDFNDSVAVSGRALTFAGFPVGDARVTLQLRVRSGFWFWSTVSPVFYETQALTDASGHFNIVIPSSAIAASPAPHGYFLATVDVTSPDGETHQARSGFNMGKPLSLLAEIPDMFVPGKSSATVYAKGCDGKSRDIRLAYEIVAVERPLYDKGEPAYKTVRQGTCGSGNVTDLFNELSSGLYTARFSPVDSLSADAVVINEVIVFRPDAGICPVNRLLWLPATSVTADENGEVCIDYGTAVEQANVFVVLCDSRGRIVSSGWEHPSRGMSVLRVRIPDKDAPARVYMNMVSRSHSQSVSVTVSPASARQKIELLTETFRDKVTPGNLETLKFRVKGIAGADVTSAVMLDMSNKAIDVLAPGRLGFSATDGIIRGLNVDGFDFGATTFSIYGVYRRLDAVSMAQPEWNFYGQSFYPVAIRFKSRNYAAMKMTGAVTSSMNAAADMDSGEMIKEEAAFDEEAMAGGAGEHVSEPEVETVFRPSEIPLAFFRPTLVTGSDGTLEVTYTVPDANTTWVLRALAYNKSLQTSSVSADIVASKPLMVSVNSTRFLRTSDTVRLEASVMNASDSAVMAHTICEILDATSNNVLATAEKFDSIASMGRVVAGIEFTAPVGGQAVIYRVRSTAGEYTDGEQVLVPVLPSEQDVVESQMFYIAPGQTSFSMPVDAVGDGRAYLKFSGNPAWEVVSALPGLRQGKISSSLEAASALFSAAVADGLMRDYPEIAMMLRKWRDNPSDSALVSMLEKNSELKSVLLSSSPWIADAMGQTERMQRLVLLLDSRSTSAVVDKAVSDLADHAVAEGGWCWTKQYPEVSEWSTMRILDILGDLERLGWLPADKRLSAMIKNALGFIDREAARDFARAPKTDFTSYCYVRCKFPEVKQSTSAAKVMSATVQRIIASWKEHSVVMKAVDAIVLNANGYNATARQILESLRQYATVTSEKGMWWQQLEHTTFNSLDKVGCTAIILDAFSLVSPSDPAIDKIRQWLVLEKTNTDWGNAIITSQVIASVLTSGRKWTVNPSGTAIRIGDALIEPGEAEYATGAITESITDYVKTGAILSIDRNADYPSFGAVVSMKRIPMDAVKAVGCADLKVDKTLSVFNGTEWQPSNSFRIGDRVKVTITLKADADMDYVVVEDMRAAGLEPVEQLPVPVWSEGLCFYRENHDAQTNIFVRRMPRGIYVLSYELFATQAGTFASGCAQVQSQYNPSISAHSAGMEISIK